MQSSSNTFLPTYPSSESEWARVDDNIFHFNQLSQLFHLFAYSLKHITFSLRNLSKVVQDQVSQRQREGQI